MKKKFLAFLIAISAFLNIAIFTGCADLSVPYDFTIEKFQHAANQFDLNVFEYNSKQFVKLSQTAYAFFAEFETAEEAIHKFEEEADYWTGGSGTFVEVNLSDYQMRRISTPRTRYRYQDVKTYGWRKYYTNDGGIALTRSSSRTYFIRIYRVGNIVVYAEGVASDSNDDTINDRPLIDYFLTYVVIR